MDITYAQRGDVALITMDDGKVNALSPAHIAAVNRALDRAEAEGLPVVLTGRPGVFCGGFDLKVMRRGNLDTLRMLRDGFLLAARLLAFPRPVVVASTGHAVAMGAFVVLAADWRVGAAGPFHYRANEVAIGLTLPRAALAICRHRLDPSALDRVTLLSEAFGPEDAARIGFLDEVAEADAVVDRAVAHATVLTELDATAFARTKARAHRGVVRAVRLGLAADLAELSLLGVKLLLAGGARPSAARS